MHELSIAENMFDIIEGHTGGPTALEKVTVSVGPLSGILPDALHLAFNEVTAARGFGNPTLAINKTDARIECRNCFNQYETDSVYSVCPACQSSLKEILSGKEFTIDSVELLEEN